MKVVHNACPAVLLYLVLTVCLSAQSVQSDLDQLGLRGPVRVLSERRTDYTKSGGGWARAVRKVEFNEAGFKTVEHIYGTPIRRIDYTYDDSGGMAAKEEFSGTRLVSSWKRSRDPDGSSTELVRYNNDGSVISRVIQEFDTAGNKTFDIGYDAKGNVTRRWQHRRSGDGVLTTLSLHRVETERSEFDAQGRITIMRRGTGNARQMWSYTYDSAGRVSETRYTDSDVRSPDVYTFVYDAAGNLAEMLHTQSSEVPVETRRYSYSTAGKVQTEIVSWYGPEGVLDRTWTYRLDSSGNVVEKVYQHVRRPFSCRWTYRYDEYGQVTEETFYDSEQRVITLTEMSWDDEGRKLSERSSGRLVDPGFNVLYEYDEEGRLLETVRLDLEGQLLSRESLRYNQWGDLEQSANYNPDGSLIASTRYDYTYDERGNWIERITLVTNNAQETYNQSTELLSRTIDYHLR